MEITIIAILASVVVAVAAYVAVRRAVAASRADSGLESRVMGRLDNLLEAASRWREESRTAVQDKIGELFDKVDQQNRGARTEMQSSLEQFRATLENSRLALGAELETNRKESRETLDAATRALSERFEKLQESNERKLTEIRGEVERKLSETLQSSGQAFKDVTARLAELHETNQRIMQFSQDLHELQSILKAPRLRGELGEVEMERMLRDCLATDQFDVQHEIDGARVDAVILNPQGKLPVDSKFPLEAWRRLHSPDLPEAERGAARRDFVKAVKGHIDTIAAKYIRPPVTLDFAVMYVPVEGVYYEVIENADLAEHARKARVFPASPMTFWALLQVTVIGFRGLQITENARRIGGLLNALKDDLRRVRDAFDKAGKQIGHAKSNMDEAAGHLERFDVKLDSITAPGIAPGGPSLPQGNPAE